MKQLATQAAQAAGKILLKYFKTLKPQEIKYKSKHESVTRADLEAEKVILKLIKKKYPEHDILSEEQGFQDRPSREYLWIVDPLDGTTNFTMKHPLFAVSIALLKQNDPILGVVFAPLLKELFIAEKGKGAFLNKKRLRVSSKRQIKDSLLTFCHGHKLKDIKRVAKFYQKFKLVGYDLRQLGSASLELGFVADGRTESIMIPGAHPWDVTAGVLLVREAGGKVTDFKGQNWNLKSPDMLASNGKIHQALLNKIKAE